MTLKMSLLLLLPLFFLPQITSLGGVFELRLRSYTHPTHRDTTGLCCSLNESDCRTPCTPKFRICVKNYQVSIDPAGDCFFGETVTEGVDWRGNGSVFHFPFNFRWPGTFSLIIEAFQDEPPSSLKTSLRLLSRLAIQQYLDISTQWKPREWKSETTTLEYSYRVRCLPDYYGEACDKMCRPRDDKFGHYTCGENGEIDCKSGWSGGYCEVALCSPTCSPLHGYCSTPSTCLCHQGWEGPSCSTCTRYPGCKHGKCSLPFQCECDEGWGGLFCNQDLNYCTNHRPCLNGGTCFNTGQGSYTCECQEGWGGVDCEVHLASGLCGCDNGGVCRDNGTALFCDCPEPYQLPNCRTKSTTCNCQNGASCVGNNCLCPPGFIGPLCATPTCNDSNCLSLPTICATAPCANGGTCLPTNSLQFTCLCKVGFNGSDCSEKTILLLETEELREELSTQHVVFVVVTSVATPFMVVVAVAVVVLMKKKRELEGRRRDECARRENERNEKKLEYVSGGDNCGGQGQVIRNALNNNKKSNLQVVSERERQQQRQCYSNLLPPHSPLLLDPYNPPPPQDVGAGYLQKSSQQSSPVINKIVQPELFYDLNLATEV